MKKIAFCVAALFAVPAAAQTTTNCRYNVANSPQFGVTCETTAPPVTRAQRSTGMADMSQLSMASPDYAAEQQAIDLARRDMALRERELRVREAEAGIASPPAPTTTQRARRMLFGF